MLNLDHVNVFLAVVDTGSFHGAAAVLGVSQSTVSHGLKRLETELDGPLVARRREGCVPSRQGEIFLPFARALVSLSDRAITRLKTERVRIGASSNVGIYHLQPHLRRLLDAGFAAPDLVIASNPDIMRQLENREIDIAFVEWWDGRPGFVAAPWSVDRLVVIVGPDHPWADRQEIDVDTLLGEPFLAGEKGTGTATLLREMLGPDAARLSVTRALGSTEAVKRAVAAGLGVSLVLEGAVVDEVKSGRLCALRVADLALEKTLWAVAPSDLISMGLAAETMRLLFVRAA